MAIDKLPSWTRIRINLKCTRSRPGSAEPAASVFQSVFKNSWIKGKFGNERKMVFHPCEGKTYNRIASGKLFSFFIVFNDPLPYTCTRFTVCLYQYLEETKNDLSVPYHFALDSFSQCETRNFKIVRRESGQIELRNRFVLQFITPLNLKSSKRKARDWRITEEKLIALLKKRIKSFFNLDAFPESAELSGFKCSPYYWKYTSSIHQSKSNGQTMLLNGYRGFLPLDVISEYILKLLLVCSEIHIGERTTYSLGYFIIRKNFSFFDRQLLDRRVIRTMIVKIKKKCERNGNLIEQIPDTDADTLLAKLTCGYQHEPYTAFPVDTDNSEKRFYYCSTYPDWIIEKIVSMLLKPVFHRMREMQDHDVCQGVSGEYVDESFFDSVDWDAIMEKVKEVIPEEDAITLRVIEQTIKAPFVFNSICIMRTKGLTAGSSLRLLLARYFSGCKQTGVGLESM